MIWKLTIHLAQRYECWIHILVIPGSIPWAIFIENAHFDFKKMLIAKPFLSPQFCIFMNYSSNSRLTNFLMKDGEILQ